MENETKVYIIKTYKLLLVITGGCYLGIVISMAFALWFSVSDCIHYNIEISLLLIFSLILCLLMIIFVRLFSKLERDYDFVRNAK